MSVIGNKKTFRNKQVDLFGKFIRKTVSLKVVLFSILGRGWGQTGLTQVVGIFAAMGRWAKEFQFFNHCENQFVNQVGIEYILVRMISVGKQNSSNTQQSK